LGYAAPKGLLSSSKAMPHGEQHYTHWDRRRSDVLDVATNGDEKLALKNPIKSGVKSHYVASIVLSSYTNGVEYGPRNNQIRSVCGLLKAAHDNTR
jgi:hypothetical protein